MIDRVFGMFGGMLVVVVVVIVVGEEGDVGYGARGADLKLFLESPAQKPQLSHQKLERVGGSEMNWDSELDVSLMLEICKKYSIVSPTLPYPTLPLTLLKSISTHPPELSGIIKHQISIIE